MLGTVLSAKDRVVSKVRSTNAFPHVAGLILLEWKKCMTTKYRINYIVSAMGEKGQGKGYGIVVGVECCVIYQDEQGNPQVGQNKTEI